MRIFSHTYHITFFSIKKVGIYKKNRKNFGKVHKVMTFLQNSAASRAFRTTCGSFLFRFGLFILVLFQRGKAQQLLAGRNAQLAIDIFIVIFQCVFRNIQNLCNFFCVFPR